MAPDKLSDPQVRRLEPPAKGNRITYDAGPDSVRGFGVRVTAAGAKSFVLNYRINGRERRHTIGQFPAWRTNQARAEAAELKRKIDSGRDPLAEREQERIAAVTVAELCDRYLREHAEPKKKPSSVEEDRRNIRLHIVPKLGGLAVAAVERQHIAALHHQMRGSPTGANRVLALLSKMFALAEVWGLRPQHSNPVHGIDRNKEVRRDRLVTADELSRLGDALAAHKGYWAGPAAIRLMALTGMRKGEVLGLRWSDIDTDLSAIRLPDSKTGPKTVPLGAPALTLLAELQRIDGNPFVLPAKRPRHAKDAGKAQHFVQVQTTWEAVTKAAGVEGLRLHDLRHAFASVGAAAGDSLYIVGKLLGHANAATTQRYAHLAPDPLRAVADRISGQVAAALSGQSAKVVPLRK